MYGYELGNSVVGMSVHDGAQTQLLAAAGSISPLYSQADDLGAMLSPVAYIWGYASVKFTKLYDEVLGYHLWEETLSLVDIDIDDDALPVSDTRRGLMERSSDGKHIRSLFQKF